jgi:hypothetical protein
MGRRAPRKPTPRPCLETLEDRLSPTDVSPGQAVVPAAASGLAVAGGGAPALAVSPARVEVQRGVSREPQGTSAGTMPACWNWNQGRCRARATA